LSDLFGAQLIGLLFTTGVLLITVDFLRKSTGSTAWALTGLIVVLAYFMQEFESGAFFKHHIAILAFFTFLVWCAWRVFLRDGAPGRDLTAAAAAASAYI